MTSQVKLPEDEKIVQTTPIPGLAAGCQEEEEPPFQLWEKKERGGALKEMFFWKVKTVGVPPPRQQPERKDNQGKPAKENEEKKPKAAAEKQSTTKDTCQIGIGRTVYKLLTKPRKQKRNMNRMEEDEKGEEEKVGWRGPREQPGEIPVKRRIFSKNNLVLTQVSFQFNLHTQY